MATTTATVLAPAAQGPDRALRRGTARGRAAGVLSAVVAVLLVSACGAGQGAETGQEVPAIPGVDVDAGPVALRDLTIPYREGGYPAGSDVPLVVRMFSTAEQPVTVTSAVSGADGPMTVPAQHIVLHRFATATTGTNPSATGLVVPSEGYLLLVPGSGPYLIAEHITAALPYGASVPVRFSLSTGESVVVDVPMAPPTYPVAGSAAPSPASSSTGASRK